MKKISLIFLTLVALKTFATGKDKDPFLKYDKIFFKTSTVELGDATLTLEGGVATKDYVKFKMKVKNNTGDYLIVKASEISLTVDGSTFKPIEKNLIIGPNDDDYKVVDVKGVQFRTKEIQIKFNGFSKVVPISGSVKAKNFKLPVAENSFEAGDFKVNHLSNEKKTDFVGVKFSVTYEGSNIGIVNPSAAALKFPNGTEFANMKAKSKVLLLERGQSDSFTPVWKNIPVANGDAQFANLEVLWRETFKEGKLTPIAPKDFTLEWDPGLTDAKK